MPNVETHCKISEERTNNEFRDLHTWMDEPQKELGMNHRRLRHDSSIIPFVERRGGKLAVLEFLYHIEIDNKITRERLEKKYSKEKIKKFRCGFCERSINQRGNCLACNVKLKELTMEEEQNFELIGLESHIPYAREFAERRLMEILGKNE